MDIAIPLPTAAYLENCRWIQTHFPQLAREHRDQWVAVDQGRVLAAGANLRDVTLAAEQQRASPDVAYEFIASSSMIF